MPVCYRVWIPEHNTELRVEPGGKITRAGVQFDVIEKFGAADLVTLGQLRDKCNEIIECLRWFGATPDDGSHTETYEDCDQLTNSTGEPGSCNSLPQPVPEPSNGINAFPPGREKGEIPFDGDGNLKYVEDGGSGSPRAGDPAGDAGGGDTVTVDPPLP